MPKQIVNNVPGATPPLPFFSQVVVSNGNVYVSGSLGTNNDFDIIGGVQLQIRAALNNMKTLLEAAGSGLEHVVKVTVYLTNLTRDIGVFNEIYAEYFSNPETLPARTCVGVTALPKGAFVQVECIAELPRGAI